MTARDEHRDLAAVFAALERRLRKLVDENQRLTVRVQELEQDAARNRREAEHYEAFRGRKLAIKERLERVLQTLEAAGSDAAPQDDADPPGGPSGA